MPDNGDTKDSKIDLKEIDEDFAADKNNFLEKVCLRKVTLILLRNFLQ